MDLVLPYGMRSHGQVPAPTPWVAFENINAICDAPSCSACPAWPAEWKSVSLKLSCWHNTTVQLTCQDGELQHLQERRQDLRFVTPFDPCLGRGRGIIKKKKPGQGW